MSEVQRRHVFVYGTLLPGEVRWPHLEPFVADAGTADTVTGTLYDTGIGYPAYSREGGHLVQGMTFLLDDARAEEALGVLDEVEGAVDGLYRRVGVTTGRGVAVWIYEYGGGLTLIPIPGGSWLRR